MIFKDAAHKGSLKMSQRDASANRTITGGTLVRKSRSVISRCSTFKKIAVYLRLRDLPRSTVMAMNLCLLLLASLASAITTSPSSGTDSSLNLTPPPLGMTYRCPPPDQLPAGLQLPTALDCLNVLTYILATTPNHNQPTRWTRTPGTKHTLLPYRRESGTCQLVVRLASSASKATIETASFDQVVGAAMRIIEVCLLNGGRDVERWGGVAVAGLGNRLDVVIIGAPVAGGTEGTLSNRTAVLNVSDAWIHQSARS